MSIKHECPPHPRERELAAGSLWLFHDDPDRVYAVVAVSNTMHRSPRHECMVIYRTAKAPDRWWTTPLPRFFEFFTQVLKA